MDLIDLENPPTVIVRHWLFRGDFSLTVGSTNAALRLRTSILPVPFH